jgi:ZIP family zinc transporter
MSQALLAALWGWLAGSSLLIGAFVGYHFNLGEKIPSLVMAFGSGVLVSALSFELMDEAFKVGGIYSTGFGFLAGSIVYTTANRVVNKKGALHRKRSGIYQLTEKDADGSGKAIAIGALMDGIPESIVIGLSLLSGETVSFVTVFAIFISNIPEALSSANGMKIAGRSKKYVFGLWFFIAFISGIASLLGYTVFGHMSESVISAITAIAAGAILSMIVDTMIPEAYEKQRDWAGVMTVFGFLVAFASSKLGGQ